MRDAVIFDMDGTLCDTSAIEHFIDGKDRTSTRSTPRRPTCPPRSEVVDAARAEHDKGRAVLVVTSREFIWRDLTLDWLVEHGIPYDALYMRIVGDYRKDVQIKTDILAQIADDGFRVLSAWDDKPAVIELWRDNGIEVTVVG